MTHEQQALWHRIRDFRIDAQGASHPFSARLARERGWTPIYAERVIEEYRRFAFLSVVAGHGVTPSKAVDEAWHLHLLYTRNYWEAFCPKALGQPLHHNPSDGSGRSEARFEDGYGDTLASYERLFGSKPPEDVWKPLSPLGERGQGVRGWRGAISKGHLWPLLTLTLPLAGCDEPLNPLDWHGPPFLGLIAALYAVALFAALVVRHRLRTPSDGPPAEDWRLHVDEQAFLNEGPSLALATALARLVQSGALEVDRKSGRMRAGPSAVGVHPLDRAILRAARAAGGNLYPEVRRLAKPTLDEMEASLRRQGLWVSVEAAAKASLCAASLVALPIALGIAKILVGLDRGRPVGFLVLGCILAVVLGIALLQPPKRSRYGDRVLAELRERNAPSRAGGPPNGDLAAGVALFGIATLADTPYAYLRPAISPASATGDGSDGGGSTCGSSSCGGGGGCGGGGCGGCGS